MHVAKEFQKNINHKAHQPPIHGHPPHHHDFGVLDTYISGSSRIFLKFFFHMHSPVTGSSILLYSSRVCPNSEILLLSPLEDENHAKPTLFPQFPGKEAINFQRYFVSFRFLPIIFDLELIC